MNTVIFPPESMVGDMDDAWATIRSYKIMPVFHNNLDFGYDKVQVKNKTASLILFSVGNAEYTGMRQMLAN